MFGNTREENLETSRLDLNWNAGADGWRTYAFALNLSGLLQRSLRLPLFLLDGIEAELTMSSAAEALRWDPQNETGRAYLEQSIIAYHCQRMTLREWTGRTRFPSS